MNLGEIKNRVLKLINEYSDRGNLIPKGNNFDYLTRMNSFIDMAQSEISQQVKIPALATFTSSSESFNMATYTLPADLKELNSIYFNDMGFYDYYIIGNTLYYREYKGEFRISYYKYPEHINDLTPDALELDVCIEGQQIIPLYVASNLLLDEYPDMSDNLMAQYMARLMKLKPNQSSISTIVNVYGW